MSLHRWAFTRSPNSLWILFLAVLSLLIGWQFLILPFTGNDEPWHSTRAYAGAHLTTILGVPKSQRPPNFHGGQVVAPAWVYGRSLVKPNTTDWLCFIHKPEIPASCASYNWNDQTVTKDPHPDSEYSPLGYFLIGLPTLIFSGEFAYYAMRATAVALAFGLLFLPLFLFYKPYVRKIPYLLFMCLVPSVIFNISTINIDGITVGASVGTGLIVAAGLINPELTKSRHWFISLIVFSTLLILFRQFGDAQLFAIMVFAGIMRLKRFSQWLLWILPALIFELWRSSKYPLTFPNSPNHGLLPHTSWLFSYFASAVSIIQTTVFDFLQGDFQEAHIPIGLALPFGIWIVVAVSRFFDYGNKRNVIATFSYITFVFLYSSLANNLNPNEWFLPWQGRYTYPGVLTLFALVWGLSVKSISNLLGRRVAFGTWSVTMLVGMQIAIVRFYKGVNSPDTLAWWTHLIGIKGNNSFFGGYRVAIGIVLELLAAFLIGYVFFASEEVDGINVITTKKDRR